MDTSPRDRDRAGGRDARSGPCAPRASSCSPSSRASIAPSELLEEALREAASRPALQSLIHSRLAWSTRFRKGFVAALEHARAALELADELDDDALRIGALVMLAELGRMTGDAEARHTRHGRTSSRPPSATPSCSSRRPTRSPMRSHAAAKSSRPACCWNASTTSGASATSRTARRCSGRFRGSSRGGRWELAAEYAARSHDVLVQYGIETPQDLLPIAWIAVHRGQLELARAHSERALELAEEQLGLHPPLHLAILGVVALWSGDTQTAVNWLDKADRRATELGWSESGMRPWSADYIEALLELGRIDDAVRVLDALEADAERLGRERVLAHVTRCRGLVAAARGASRRPSRSWSRLWRARGRRRFLRAGSRAARARHRPSARAAEGAARAAIAAALAGFERLGAATLDRHARAELGSIGGRTREEGLTAAERRVAALVAEGRTNREVAAALFLGERTVGQPSDAHLREARRALANRARARAPRRAGRRGQGSDVPVVERTGGGPMRKPAICETIARVQPRRVRGPGARAIEGSLNGRWRLTVAVAAVVARRPAQDRTRPREAPVPTPAACTGSRSREGCRSPTASTRRASTSPSPGRSSQT